MARDGSYKPITVRIAREEYQRLKDYASARNIPLNSVVAEAISQYGAKIERHQAISRIQDFQRQLRSGRREGSNSVDLLRELRETRSHREIEDARQCGGKEP